MTEKHCFAPCNPEVVKSGQCDCHNRVVNSSLILEHDTSKPPVEIMTVPLGNDSDEARKSLAEMMSIYKEEIKIDDSAEEISINPKAELSEPAVSETRSVKVPRVSSKFFDAVVPYHQMDLPTGVLTYLDYVETGDSPDGIKSIGLKVFTTFVEVANYEISAGVTREQTDDMTKYGIDAKSMVFNALNQEATQSMEKVLLEKMFQLGSKHDITPMLPKLKWYQKIVYSLLKRENLPVIKKTERTRSLVAKVLGMANLIAVTGRRGPANFLVCSTGMATLFEDSNSFVYSTMDEIKVDVGNVYPIGQIAGITIYVDPRMRFDDTSILVGRTLRSDEPGIHYFEHTRETFLKRKDFEQEMICLKIRGKFVEVGQKPESAYAVCKFRFEEDDVKSFLLHKFFPKKFPKKTYF